MLAAGLGIAFISADMLGARGSSAGSSSAISAPDENKPRGVPNSLRRVGEETQDQAVILRPQRTNIAKLKSTIESGKEALEKNYKIDNGSYRYYYLYARRLSVSADNPIAGKLE
jgi:hypothetical protein